MHVGINYNGLLFKPQITRIASTWTGNYNDVTHKNFKPLRMQWQLTKKYLRLQHKILIKHVLASTCGTQGKQHRDVSEHNNAHYHPSPAHLKMQWFIPFFLLLTHCFSAFLRKLKWKIEIEMENWNWNGKLKFSALRTFHTPHFPHSSLSTLLTFHPALHVFHRTIFRVNFIHSKLAIKFALI